MTDELTSEQIREMNENYRSHEAPSDTHVEAFYQAVTLGGVEESLIEEMVDMLYDPFPQNRKELPVDVSDSSIPGVSGLGTAVVRKDRCIHLHISEKLWKMQPIGVLLRPIDDKVRKAGEALVTDVTPRSAEVEAEVMPCYHYKLTIEPTPVWIAKWMGENGYPTIE